jgi:segregation and condensation protein B
VARGLVEAVGRSEAPGQPVLYGTTITFLEQLGIGSIDDLPSLGVFAPPGPPPDEPPLGAYRAARRTLGRESGVRASASEPEGGESGVRASASEPEGDREAGQ